MSGLPRRARIYLLAVCAAAAAALAASFTWLLTGGREQALGGRPELAAVFAQLVVLSIISQHFPLAIGPRRKQDLSQMVHLAIVLLASTPLAIVLVGCAEAVGQAVFLLRRDRHGRRQRGVNSVLFNTGQITLGVGVAGLAAAGVRMMLTGVEMRPVGVDLSTLSGVIVAAVTLYTFNTVAVAAMVA